MRTLRPGVPISKESLMMTLYGGEDGPNERVLDVFICKLRGQLGRRLGFGDDPTIRAAATASTSPRPR